MIEPIPMIEYLQGVLPHPIFDHLQSLGLPPVQGLDRNGEPTNVMSEVVIVNGAKWVKHVAIEMGTGKIAMHTRYNRLYGLESGDDEPILRRAITIYSEVSPDVETALGRSDSYPELFERLNPDPDTPLFDVMFDANIVEGLHTLDMRVYPEKEKKPIAAVSITRLLVSRYP